MTAGRFAALLVFIAVVVASVAARAQGDVHHPAAPAFTETTAAASPIEGRTATAPARVTSPARLVASDDACRPHDAGPSCGHHTGDGCDCGAVCVALILPTAPAAPRLAGRPPVETARPPTARPVARAPPLPPPRA